MTFEDRPSADNPYFDQRYCGKVMRVGAVACLAVLFVDVVFLAAVHPPPRCPAWNLPNEQASAWGLVFAVSLWAVGIGYIAIRWDWFARLHVEQLQLDERLAERETQAGVTQASTNFRTNRARTRLQYFHMIDFGGLLVSLMILSVLLCALPVLYAIVACYSG